jgi:hypothetical protein
MPHVPDTSFELYPAALQAITQTFADIFDELVPILTVNLGAYVFESPDIAMDSANQAMIRIGIDLSRLDRDVRATLRANHFLVADRGERFISH